MGFGKWIGGIVGFMAAGPLGALAGYAIGSMLESNDEEKYSGGGYGGYSGRSTYENQAYGQRNSFLRNRELPFQTKIFSKQCTFFYFTANIKHTVLFIAVRNFAFLVMQATVYGFTVHARRNIIHSTSV